MVIFRGVTSGGARYEINDEYMAKRGSDEERKVIEEQRMVAHKILVGYAQRCDKEQTA